MEDREQTWLFDINFITKFIKKFITKFITKSNLFSNYVIIIEDNWNLQLSRIVHVVPKMKIQEIFKEFVKKLDF